VVDEVSSNFEVAVDTFLSQFGQSVFRASILNRIWKAFMAYSLCLVAEAFRNKGYVVRPTNHSQGFTFKCFPAGNPRNYSYFTAQKENEFYEIRLSVDVQNLQYKSLRLNIDLVVITPNSINADGVVDSEQDLVAFIECKNLRGFPELVAGIEGMTYELQRRRLWRNSLSTYRIPSCLLLSGSGRSISYINNRYLSKNMSIRIFDLIQPGSLCVQNFIQTWF
jgi:hypothetical protein